VRTNIVRDDKLVREAMKPARVKTRREAVDIALRRFVQNGKQKSLLALFGTGGIRPEYDYDGTRKAAFYPTPPAD
jgi:Arc/MetJ family transcription regulator